IDIAEDVLVDERREAVELEQGVLKRRGGKQKLAAIGRGPADALAHLVARAVGVAELVRLVDDDEVPRDATQLVADGVREVEGEDDDGPRLEGVAPEPSRFLVRLRIEDEGRQVEFFLELEGPLLTERGGA